MDDLKEYIVTLKNFDDLDDFYNDMETPGGNLYIPDRAVDVSVRRPISRNTHYMLTEDEATTLSNDPRVLAVTLNPKDQGIEAIPFWTQTSNYWSKTAGSSSEDLNWGILRCYEGVLRPNWGVTTNPNQSGTVTVNASGKHVDVVIMDGHFNPSHPEFAVNTDGTGGSRVNQFNWFSLNPAVTGQSAGVYMYTPYVGSTIEITNDNNHGCHVASTVCGNTLGWARDANIYNINPYSTNSNFSFPAFAYLYTYDYVREFHKTKAVNPVTGIKNPTIINSSWGLGLAVPRTSITSINYRGSIIPGELSKAQLNSYGVYVAGNDNAYFMTTDQSVIADVEDAINDGIICVGAAGNFFYKIDIPSGIDYNNSVTTWGTIYYHRGSSPGSAATNICVGSVRANTSSPGGDAKLTYSHCGPRVDIFSPGHNIAGSVMTNTGNASNAVTDSRSPIFYKVKYEGTSMASPQVAGILACWLETNPRVKQQDAINFLKNTGKTGQIPNTNGGYSDTADLQGAPNLYLTYTDQRPNTGVPYPKVNLGNRPTAGQTWPRANIFRYGS